MEIKINKTVEDIITINLPYYCKNSVRAYKILSEKKSLIINTYDAGIEVCNYIPNDLLTKNEPITEAEFKETYNEILTKLNEYL